MHRKAAPDEQRQRSAAEQLQASDDTSEIADMTAATC
jgi:hypothetical protein